LRSLDLRFPFSTSGKRRNTHRCPFAWIIFSMSDRVTDSCCDAPRTVRFFFSFSTFFLSHTFPQSDSRVYSRGPPPLSLKPLPVVCDFMAITSCMRLAGKTFQMDMLPLDFLGFSPIGSWYISLSFLRLSVQPAPLFSFNRSSEIFSGS